MRIKPVFLLLVLIGVSGALSFHPKNKAQAREPYAILPATASELAAAMGVPGGDLNSADLMGTSASGVGVSDAAFAAWFPVEGSTFAIMSTGYAVDTDPPKPAAAPSGELGGYFNSELGDLVRLHLNLDVPVNIHCLNFDFSFHSAEYPYGFGNDTFTAQLNNLALSISGGKVVAPTNFAVDGSGNNVSPFDGFEFTTLTNSAFDYGTSLFRASTPVTAGSTIDLYFSIQDLYDDEIDSAVFLDNFQWSGATCTAGTQDLISTLYLPSILQP